MFASEEFPPELPEEGLRALTESVQDGLRKIGLYVEGMGINIDTDEDPAERVHSLMLQCGIGDVAFSKRVQDPEGDSFDTEFKKIELGATDDQISGIINQYKKGYDLDETVDGLEDGEG